ncbi:GNAT family N-acetyltransferase [Halorubrum ezzemoulense]|uniref:GNAT family N-acetyltransferase n=1 Tax=Halorubrum ezzemoulense TaxID=337243 RepID=UPI00232A85E8|nr:GNAT family N-acetyltransferase [Halorubrum ezzemoulense]MDB2224878.1 GNAT family N-acetyltransferase [Halorubrum ezzemoulense]MDB2273147.1 GNAT family N-acetyltransferase [Halorubrum ezzemoulense]MDB9247631.1 GNAT family N-acetyltransferase [Halorubrum ezzemoulense]MDB9258460.1 GNAT family N-acetyltransferase [Halorubrum ezzemoulense]MDB9261178.1 GNAT family N-acetyltransferase [Halorubrum ezzemoulense]
MSDDAVDVADADRGLGESPLSDGYELRETTPSVEAFRRLRREAGMTDRSREAVERGLPNTTFGVHVVETASGSTVGMARLVGDDGSVFHLSDTAVAPPHQGRGIGTAMVGALVAWLRANAPDGAYVNRFADVDGFYERWGFERTAPASKAMGIRTEEL